MDIITVDYTSPNASKLFTDSLKNTGFAVLRQHPIDKNDLFELYDLWEAFFKSEDRFDYVFDKENQDGYFPDSEIAKGETLPDLKEFFHYYPWGQVPEHLSEKTNKMYQQMSAIASECLNWIEEFTPPEISTRFSTHLSDMIKDAHRTMLRAIYYPALTGNENPNAIRAAAHGDINLITLLPAATQTGLQVKDKDGNWIDVSCDPGSIIVNIADMLEMCSQGYYPSTIHRVINPEGEDRSKPRLSMPLFLHARDEVVLSETHTANDFRLERLRELGLI